MASSQNVRNSIHRFFSPKIFKFLILVDLLFVLGDVHANRFNIEAGSKQRTLIFTNERKSGLRSVPASKSRAEVFGPQELIHPMQVLDIKFKPSSGNSSDRPSLSFNQNSPFQHNYHRHFPRDSADADMSSSFKDKDQRRYRRATAAKTTAFSGKQRRDIDLEAVRANITRTLNTLLRGYDRDLRPGFMEQKPLQISVSVDVRNLGPVSEQDMDYVFDCYFRQRWRDERLVFGQTYLEHLSFFTLDAGFLKQIWKPNTYFHNGALSHMHTITRENIFIRLYPDGTLYCSIRLTVRAKCPMSLHNFPMDVQSCPLIFGSFSYPDDQIVYKWVGDDAIELSDSVQMAQFYLSSYRQGNCTAQFMSGPTHALLLIEWQLKRQMGFFMLQVYLPCTLIVILSWVGFWLNREATSDRVTLGIMSVLTLSSLGIDARKDLPKMSHGTALDWFLIVCYLYVSASLILFCIVHYFTKVNNSGEEPVILQLTRQHQAVKHRRKIHQILLHERRVNRARLKGSPKAAGQWSIGVVASTRSADDLASYRSGDRSGGRSALKSKFKQQNVVFHTENSLAENNIVGNDLAHAKPAQKRISRPHVTNHQLLNWSTAARGRRDDETSELSDSHASTTAHFHYSRALSADHAATTRRHVHYLDDAENDEEVSEEEEEEEDNDVDYDDPPPAVFGDENFNDEEIHDTTGASNFMWRRDVYGRQCRVPSSRGRVLGVASQTHPLHKSAATISANSLRAASLMRRTSLVEPVQMVQMFPPARRRASLLEQGETLVRRCFYCVVGNEQYRYRQATRRKTMESHNSVSMVDHISRVVFPLSFIVFNFIYWTWFRSDDALSDDANREWQNFMNCSVDEAKKYTKMQF